MNLAELIQRLIEEEGLTEVEASQVAAATVKARRGTEVVRRQTAQPLSVQNDPRRVDYGHETPAQAKERWYAQELADPQGLFSGGSTAGGVFGDSPIATESFDPGAVARTVGLRAQLGAMQTQAEMVSLLRELSAEVRESRQMAAGRERPVLTTPTGERRQLGRKKR